MSSPTQDDDLLAILLTNLRNTAATFGEGSPPHETVRTILEEHLQGMKKRGAKTNISSLVGPPPNGQPRNVGRPGLSRDNSAQMVVNFENLALRPKPSN